MLYTIYSALFFFSILAPNRNISGVQIYFFSFAAKKYWLGRGFFKVCGRNIPPAWYVNSQLQGMYQPSFFEVPPLRSGEPVASQHLYLLVNTSHVKDDETDILQAVDAFAPWGECFVKHPNKFELLHLMALTCQKSTLTGGLPRHLKDFRPDHYGLTVSVKYQQDHFLFTHHYHLSVSQIPSIPSSKLAEFESVQHISAG